MNAKRAIELLEQHNNRPKHNLLNIMSNMIVIDSKTLPIPEEVMIKGISSAYLDKCNKYIDIHEPSDFKLFWGMSPEDYPDLYERSEYINARLCYLLTDCFAIKNWSQCWKHENDDNTPFNYVISIDGDCRYYYSNLYKQLKKEIPEKQVKSKCTLCCPEI